MGDERVINIEFMDILKAVKKRFYIIILISITLLALAIYYGNMKAITFYEAKAIFIIGTSEDSSPANDAAQFQIDDVTLLQEFMGTYCAIAKTTAVSEKAIEKLGINMSPEELKKCITATAQPNTPFMDMELAWENQQEAIAILDTITEVYIEEIKNIYPTSSVKIMEKSKNPQITKVGEQQLYTVKVSLIFGNTIINNTEQSRNSYLYNNQVPAGSYNAIAGTLAVSEKTVKKANLNISPEQLKSSITVTRQTDTPFIELLLRWTNYKETLIILDSFTEVYTEEFKSFYPIIDLRVIEKDKDPKTVVVSNRILYAIAGLAAGIISSLLLIFALEFMNDTIKTECDVSMDLKLPVIGIIPKERKRIRITGIESFNKLSDAFKEAYRVLRTNIYFAPVFDNVNTVIISSGGPHEGRSTVASMLAIAMAQDGRKTILIDCDLRKPDIHNMFVLEQRGLSNILVGEAEWKDTVCESPIKNLSILPAGFVPANPSELLSLCSMKKLIDDLKCEFDYVILDTPPIGLVTDAQVLSIYADGYILVVNSGKTKKEEAKKTRTLIQYSEGRILGVLLNETIGSTFYHYYKPYYKAIKKRVKTMKIKKQNVNSNPDYGNSEEKSLKNGIKLKVLDQGNQT